MTTYFEVPCGNDANFTVSGVPATGAKLFTYLAGTTTKQTTYTDSTGGTPNANPIVLSSNGYPASGGNVVGIWVAQGIKLKLVLAPSTDTDPPTSPYWTRDQVAAINDPTQNILVNSEWVASGLTPTFVTSTSFTVTGDQTAIFTADRRIKSTNSGGTIYSTITSSAFTTLTTVNVKNDSGVLDSGISAVSYGLLSGINRSLPPINTLADQTDPSKKVTFDASGVTTATTRTLAVNDANGTIITSGNPPQFNAANATLVASVASSALTIALKTAAGNDPSTGDHVLVDFRNATVATGDQTVLKVTAATSLVISSGSTLGATNSTAFKIWIVGFNDGGTFRLGAMNPLSGVNIYPLGQFSIASATAEGGVGGADSAQVFYANASVTSKSYVILGFLSYESGLATVGTYNVTPTRIQLFVPGFTPLPGVVIQRLRSASGAVQTGTTAVPYDDTIPQIGEGDQYFSQAITPSSAANVLYIRSQLMVSAQGVNGQITTSIFQDAVANALATVTTGPPAINTQEMTTIEHMLQSSTTSATTFRIRTGNNVTNGITINGNNTARLYGGVANSYLQVEEIMA